MTKIGERGPEAIMPARGGLIGTRADRSVADDVSDVATQMRKWFGVGSGDTSKFAPVAPIHIYEALANRDYKPKSLLLLAHDVVKDENIDRYIGLFNRGAWKDVHIIMDNSLIEVKEAITLDQIQHAVSAVQADVVILPDSLTDGPESAKLTLDTFDSFKTAFSKPYSGDKKVELLAVIQGETMKGFMTALEMLAPIAPHIDWVSVPRRTESKFGYHRLDLIDFVRMFFPTHKLHLLGFSDYPWEDIRAAQLSDVQSIDSAAPLRIFNGRVASENGGPRITKGDMHEPIDWWNQVKYEDFMLQNIQKLNQLIG